MAQSGNTSGQGNSKPTPIYKDWTVLQLAALVLLVDQFTKYLVIELLPYGWSFPSEGFFRFTHVHNTGSAFGIFQGLNTPLVFVSFIGVIILVLIYRSQPHPSIWLRLSLGLQLGGAFGNLIDRLRLGYVTDFIDVSIWPVFNLADASIVIGLLLLAWIFLRPGPETEPEPAAESAVGVSQQTPISWCPICDGEMVQVPGGWHCLSCGVKERVDLRGVASHQAEPLPISSHLDGSDRHSVPMLGDTGLSKPGVDGLSQWSEKRLPRSTDDIKGSSRTTSPSGQETTDAPLTEEHRGRLHDG